MHGQAKEMLARAARSGVRFVTTDYVLDEIATLLKARRLGHLAGTLFEKKSVRFRRVSSGVDRS